MNRDFLKKQMMRLEANYGARFTKRKSVFVKKTRNTY